MEKKRFKSILMIILFIIAIIIVILAIHTIRNYAIISNLQKKEQQYANITNYHIKVCDKETSAEKIITANDYYKKDGKQIFFIEYNNGDKLIEYNNGQRRDMFMEKDGTKKAKLNMDPNIINEVKIGILPESTFIQKIFNCMFSKITNTKVNEKACYLISGRFNSIIFSTEGKSELYIERDTGLSIKMVSDKYTQLREYEFNSVEDSIFQEPDISEYILEDNL